MAHYNENLLVDQGQAAIEYVVKSNLVT